ncbi:hypothetical protein ACFORL_10790 [Legionella dresdenensis]|uniref:Uncharacterized protein n=1 Tax=Legionella dresdenensis TaxID=450200 RepID=A0ABV8CHP0_9GAMM
MNKLAALLFSALSFDLFAAVSPADLIKVTKENNPGCVEYYNYNNEMYCSIKALQPDANSEIKPVEKQKIIFDERVWQPAWSNKTPQITTIEYVPAGDKVEQWQELVTSQFIPGLQKQVTLQQFADNVLKNLEQTGLTSHIKTIKNQGDMVLFEFQIAKPDNLIQDELQKITVGPDGFYILHYAIRKADMGEEKRQQWIKNLSESSIN